jgi:hypothetical protein
MGRRFLSSLEDVGPYQLRILVAVMGPFARGAVTAKVVEMWSDKRRRGRADKDWPSAGAADCFWPFRSTSVDPGSNIDPLCLRKSRLPFGAKQASSHHHRYRYVKAYPITLEEDGSKVAFHLIHASDHPDAPHLMDRAYLEVCGDNPGVDLGVQRALPFS